MTEHIKMPDVAPLVRVLANGTQTVFIYPFPIFASEDLAVYFNGARQIAGFTIEDAGNSDGGTVTFEEAPPENTIVTLERRMSLERMSDFLEGGDFSAYAINTELDYLVAALQQVNRDQSSMLRYSDYETPSNTTLPGRAVRANKALGFDGDGHPVAVSLEGSMASPDFTATGTGAVTRDSTDKLKDFISIKDFGAVGDGITNDTIAIQNTIAAHDLVYVPPGTYLVNDSITIGERKTLIGAGNLSVIKTTSSITVIEFTADHAILRDLRIEGGEIGIRLYGRDRPCVNNSVTDVSIFESETGIQLDGYTSTDRPTYWNNFDRVLVEHPILHGIHLTKSGAGDTPNANKFHQCRVYSHGTETTGCGLYIEYGSFSNSFIDFEANVNGTAQACIRVGAGSNKTLFINPYTESFNEVPNIKLDSGSQDTAIYNLLSASNGAAIWDLSGGNYTAYNAGYPFKNRLQKTTVTDMNATLQRFDTEYIDTTGTITLDTSHSIHLISAFGGALTVELPNAGDAVGALMVVKKIDTSKNIITVTEDGGDGPDSTSYYLGGENDYVMMVSNGAEWFVIASNRSAGNTRYFDGSGTYDIDMAVDVYLLSSFGGALTARLPPANATKSIGRMITIKKTDVSGNAVTVTEQGGSGPDQYSQVLDAQYDAITVISDGGSWHIVSRFG